MEYSMNRELADYSLYVFDLDGTLYDQPKLRTIMAVRLASYYLKHPGRIYDLFILQTFRSIKDSWDDDKYDMDEQLVEESRLDALDVKICSRVAKKCHVGIDRACEVVYRWIYENPLSALYAARDEKIIAFIDECLLRGKKVVILSDYPVADKLKALKCQASKIYSSTDKDILELKPSPKGLLKIISDFNIDKSEVIMIGDRMSKDGMAAVNASVDYKILPRRIKDRY